MLALHYSSKCGRVNISPDTLVMFLLSDKLLIYQYPSKLSYQHGLLHGAFFNVLSFQSSSLFSVIIKRFEMNHLWMSEVKKSARFVCPYCNTTANWSVDNPLNTVLGNRTTLPLFYAGTCLSACLPFFIYIGSGQKK